MSKASSTVPSQFSSQVVLELQVIVQSDSASQSMVQVAPSHVISHTLPLLQLMVPVRLFPSKKQLLLSQLKVVPTPDAL